MDDTASSHSVESADASRPLPMTFGQWKEACMRREGPSDKGKIRTHAAQIFAFLSKHVEHTTSENVVMTTKSSHNEALAQLVQELGPAFSEDATYGNRICALSCICGAIEGCQAAGLSYNITNLLGNFFLGQCGPLEPEDDIDEDTDENVRDAAVVCLGALVRARIQEPSTPDEVQKTIQLHLDLAKKGVEKRCAAPDFNDEMDFDHGYNLPTARGNDIRGGLSTLPRSRRSLCFDLVRSAVDGLASIRSDDLRMTSVTSDLASFASFADNCLHGESDPRCLLQLLRMLHAVQTNMLPFFQTTTSPSTRFPLLNLFDAVAPYYPIHFTPPPNDVYGITRQGLHDALMAVLCNTGYDGMEDGNDTMLNLSASIFLERLMNVDGDDAKAPNSVDDKLESIADLSSLLFQSNVSVCDQMNEDTVRELSTVLFLTHAEAASGAKGGGENGTKYKELADSCRTLVSKVAYNLELSGRSVLWNTFVRDTVQTRCHALSTTPQSSQGRSSIAYLACLSSCGGPRTMTLCLQSCLTPLVDLVDREKDEEKIAAAVYGIGAFFSSFHVALNRGLKDGVALHPHPLESYSGRASRSLFRLMGIGENASKADTKEATPVSLYIAAVHALESILTVTPLSLLEVSDIDNICELLDAMAGLVDSSSEKVYANEIDSSVVSLKVAASRTLGSSLGTSFDASSTASGETGQFRCVLDESNTIRVHLRETIYPKILESSEVPIAPKKESQPLRFDWRTLAYACEISQSSATHVVSGLVDSLNVALQRKEIAAARNDMRILYAMRFRFVIQHGGPPAISAFCSLSVPYTSPIELIKSLCSLQPTEEDKAKSMASPEKTGVMRVSALMLPPTSDDEDEVKVMVERAYDVLPYLTPAYSHPFSRTQMNELLSNVSQVLPPLSVWQSGQLCVVLPFLSAVLSQGSGYQTDDARILDTLHAMSPYLADCALDGNFDSRARSAAASCLYHIITKFQMPDAADCMSNVVLGQNVVTSIVGAAEARHASSGAAAEGAMVDLCEALDVLSLLGTAAACRGKSSSTIADDVARFFIELSCDGEASAPFLTDEQVVDIAVPSQARLNYAAASAFGTMVSTEDGGPFWRQRIMHLAAKHLLQASTGLDTRSTLSANALTPAEIGRSMIACFIVTSSSLTTLGDTAVNAMADRIMLDFSRTYSEGADANAAMKDLGILLYPMKELILSAVVKLVAVAPRTVAKYNSTLVPCLLNAYADSSPENPMLVLPCKMLALQGLYNAAELLEQTKSTLLAVKPVVVSVLSSAADDPSSALRQAAMDTRNAWYTLGG